MKDKERYIIIEILKFVIAIGLYMFAFFMMHETFFKELMIALLFVLGGFVQRLNQNE